LPDPADGRARVGEGVGVSAGGVTAVGVCVAGGVAVGVGENVLRPDRVGVALGSDLAGGFRFRDESVEVVSVGVCVTVWLTTCVAVGSGLDVALPRVGAALINVAVAVRDVVGVAVREVVGVGVTVWTWGALGCLFGSDCALPIAGDSARARSRSLSGLPMVTSALAAPSEPRPAAAGSGMTIVVTRMALTANARKTFVTTGWRSAEELQRIVNRALHFGNPAVLLAASCVRCNVRSKCGSVALRPHLSMGLPLSVSFRDPSYAADGLNAQATIGEPGNCLV
jgi:hypothetical protein